MSIGKIIQPIMPLAGKGAEMGSISAVSGGEAPNKSAIEQFGSFIADGIHDVNTNVKGFEALSEKFAKGGTVSVQELMLSSERADISLKLMVSLRNKVLEAYQEVMRMPV